MNEHTLRNVLVHEVPIGKREVQVVDMPANDFQVRILHRSEEAIKKKKER